MDTSATNPSDASVEDAPKKFIRTFAGDMETLKQGGTPGLAPFSEPIISEPPPQPPPPEVVPPPAPTPQETVLPLPAIKPVDLEQYKPERLDPVPPPPAPAMSAGNDSLRVVPSQLPFGSPAAGPDAGPPPAPELIPPSPVIPVPVPLETYQSDFSAQMKEQQASVTTVLAAQQDALTGEPHADLPTQTRSNRIYIVAGVILLLVSTGGTYYAYSHYTTAIAPVVPQFVASAPIFVDERDQVSGMGTHLTASMLLAVTKPLAANNIRLLSLSPASTTDTVFSALQFVNVPGILLRNINVGTSMAGVVNVNATQSPFFILNVTSYSDTFSGMLMWEHDVLRDTSSLFPPFTPPLTVTTTTPVTTVATTTSKANTKKKTVAAAPTKVATTTSPITIAPVALTFRDEIVSNHDVRIYRDAYGQSVLMYGYWNKTTLIIARDPSAFAEIMDRLANSHK